MSAPLPAMRRSRRPRSAGQAVVEFALLLPGLLAVVGMSLDVARVFGSWMELQSVTRDTAEWLASDSAIRTLAEAQTGATLRVCVSLTGTTTCSSDVALIAPTLSADFAAGTAIPPVYRVTVTVRRDVRSIFLWPIIRAATGSDAWRLVSSVTYEVWRGRM